MPRLNKANLYCTLRRKIIALERKHDFNPNSGYAQVRGKPTEVQVAYGEMVACKQLLSQVEGGYLDDAAEHDPSLSEEQTIAEKARRPGSRGGKSHERRSQKADDGR